MSTYEARALAAGHDISAALKLYAWNARICGAFLTPLHICEVVMRNAVADALESVHGPQWPWNPGFDRSLPRQSGPGYNALKDLQCVRQRTEKTGQVIAELKFVFWEKMFTSRHDDRIWNTHLRHVLPNLMSTETIAEHRERIFGDLNSIRMLRNRIAHHEPIFARDLLRDFHVIQQLIEARCSIAAQWLLIEQQVMDTIKDRPF
ncbi:hypothetical protein [Pseudomonas sp. NPDC088444]|uniref:hypothetical protein n=1 Tax=Pseudomonas sp. NPDC088444 TaxID=3364456 RepID=UPI00384CD766